MTMFAGIKSWIWRRRGVGEMELTRFTRQLSVMIEAGFPVANALATLERMRRPGGMRSCVRGIRERIEQGGSVPEAFAAAPDTFDALYVSLLRAGVAGGRLGQVLARIADCREKRWFLRQRIWCALVNPLAGLVGVAILFTLLFTVMMPAYKDFFTDLGVRIPSLVRLLLDVSDVWTGLGYWPLMALAATVVLALTVRRLGKTGVGPALSAWFARHVPIYGGLLRRFALSRFCRNLGELTAVDVPILEALNIAGATAADREVATSVAYLRQKMVGGEAMSDVMRRLAVFPPMLADATEVGWETDTLDRMLIGVANTLDVYTEERVHLLLKLLEMVWVVVVALLIVLIYLPVLLPLIRMINYL